MRSLRSGTIVFAVLLLPACSEDQPQPFVAGGSIPDEVRAIERIAIVHDGAGEFALREGVTGRVRVRALDESGAPIPGADAHLRLSSGNPHIASVRPLDDDLADGERPFSVETRRFGRAELRSSVERRALTPLLADTIEVRVVGKGPDPSLLPGTYTYRGTLDRNGLTCFGAAEVFVDESVEVDVDGNVVTAGFDLGSVSGVYDPLEVTWAGLGAGRDADDSPLEIRLTGTWRGLAPPAPGLARFNLQDSLALSRVDESGTPECRTVYLGVLRLVEE